MQTALAHDIHKNWHFLELALTQAILSPQVDLGLIGDLAIQLTHYEGSLGRAMHAAIHHAPQVASGPGEDFLEVVDVLLDLGVPLPRNAAWTAYGAQMTARMVNPRAQAMTRLVVRRGGQGVEALHRTAARWPEHTQVHKAFLQSLR